MKKLLCLAAVLLSSVCVADDFIYCPSIVECVTQNDFSSCQSTDNNWKRDTFQGKVQKGIYKLNHVWSGYQIDSDDDEINKLSRCQYINIDVPHVTKLLWLVSTKLLDASVENDNGWMIFGDSAQCGNNPIKIGESLNPSICPMELANI
ncbi:MAG TPA: hypothetical protein VHM20_05830 [Gammaproteobacteria bacterium]|jgi:hypothetical protein|nr:hypothetical protein [Gammaproteobacteria bacterium]